MKSVHLYLNFLLTLSVILLFAKTAELEYVDLNSTKISNEMNSSRTLCVLSPPKLIEVTQKSISVSVKNQNCSSDNLILQYGIKTKETTSTMKNLTITNENKVDITDIKPNKTYNITILSSDRISSKPLTFKKIKDTNNGLGFTIKLHTKMKNGYVKYDCFSNYNNFNKTEKVTNKIVYIESLKPSTNCSVFLYNNTNELIDRIQVITDDLQIEQKFPHDIKISEQFAIIYFRECLEIKPNQTLNFTIQYQCFQKEKNCSKKDFLRLTHIACNGTSGTSNVTLSLSPFTEYNITITLDQKSKNYGIRKTPPIKPNPVVDLQVYCASPNKTKLMCKLPEIQTGELENYFIFRSSKANETKVKYRLLGNFAITEVITAEILKGDSRIEAKNKNVDKLSRPIFIRNIGKPSAQEQLKKYNYVVKGDKFFFSWNTIVPANFTATINETIIHIETRNDNFNVRVDGDFRYQTLIKDNNCENAELAINITTLKSLSDFPKRALIEVCAESNCSILIPIPEDASNRTKFVLVVKSQFTENILWTTPILTRHENNYFEVPVQDKKAVSLNNSSFLMYLQDKTTLKMYAVSQFQPSYIRTAAVITLLGMIITTFLYLGYLIIAFYFKIYPFEVRRRSYRQRRTSKWYLRQSRPLTEHYKKNKIKTTRKKVEVPTNTETEHLFECVISTETLSSITSKPIQLVNFENYLIKSLGEDTYSNDLTFQYKRIEISSNETATVGRLNNNIDKNRYKNLIAFDNTRVVLKNHDTDYINANYIDGYENERAFIATQAPLKSTLSDFWWMVWQENCSYIIMLTKTTESGTKKCEQYWPFVNEKHRFGRIQIENLNETIYSDYILRELQIYFNEGSRTVWHLQYTTWPHHGVPEYPQNFTPLVKKILAFSQQNAPIVVHCNAGCGRTGTLILCDIVLRMAAKEKVLDFVKVLSKMRKQRIDLVNNVNQYVFVHFVVMECLFGVDFSIPINDDFQDNVMKLLRKTTVKPLMQQLDKVMEFVKKRQASFILEMSKEDETKNRVPDILPGPTQILLSSNDNTTIYINAVKVDCYRCPNKFIVTQQPLPNTLEDFWRLVNDFSVNTILSLNEIDGEDSTCPQFWFWNNNQFKLRIVATVQKKSCTITKIKVSHNKTVNVIQMHNWKKETFYPPSQKDLILMWKETFHASWKGDSQIVVTCYDGATASGLFVALAYLLEKMNYEQSCDVYSAIRTVRQSREQFVEDWGQMEFLYKAAKVYIEEFDNYENFN